MATEKQLETKLVYAAINAVMRDVGAISKNRRNPDQNYQFRGIDDVYNALQPAMIEHGLFIVPNVIDCERIEYATRSGGQLHCVILTVRHDFTALDGSSIPCITVGEAFDTSDKATNKAMSAAMKYACLEVFCIPTEGDHDTENHSHEAVTVPEDVDIGTARQRCVVRLLDVHKPLVKAWDAKAHSQPAATVGEARDRVTSLVDETLDAHGFGIDGIMTPDECTVLFETVIAELQRIAG